MRALPLLGLLAAFLLVKLAGNPDIFAKQTVVGNPLPGGSAAGGIFDITTILGEIIVFLFYWFKFNEWAGADVAPKSFRLWPARHFTTWLRFLGWNTFYGLLMIGVYSVIIFFPEMISRVLDSFASASSTLKAPLPGVSVAGTRRDPHRGKKFDRNYRKRMAQLRPRHKIRYRSIARSPRPPISKRRLLRSW